MTRNNSIAFGMKGMMALLVSALLSIMMGCKKAPADTRQTAKTGTLSVYVVNYPLQYFAERIGGDSVDVTFPAPTDGDPAYWSPEADVVTAYQKADIVLLNGAGYAKWVGKVSLPTSILVDTSKRLKDRLIAITEDKSHIHGPEGKHEHGRLAFTTWLDPTLAVEQARAVRDALVAAKPDSREQLDSRFAELEKELLEIDRALKDVVSSAPTQRVVFSHPVYQYFDRKYALNGKRVHWEPGEMPTETMWQEFAKLRKEHAAQWMIWEGEPLPSIVKKLDAMGVKSIVFNPCGNRPEQGDFLAVMKRNVEQLRRVYSGSK